MADKDLYSGLIRLHILHHACQEPIFGVGIMEELARHGYRLSPGTLYPLLHGLEERGYLRSSQKSAGQKSAGGQSRREYRATPKGRKALVAAKVKVRELFSELLEDKHTEESPLRESAGAMELMKELIGQLREGVKSVQEPKAQAILETSAEVVKGLLKAFDEYEKENSY
jgi:DNA-binding PadR family transcriptional regulator